MSQLSEKQLEQLIEQIVDTYKKRGINHIEGLHLPNPYVIYEVIDDLSNIIFPGYAHAEEVTKANLSHYVGDMICRVYRRLVPEVAKSLAYRDRVAVSECTASSEEIVYQFLARMAEVRSILKQDIMAAEGGDPAAQSMDEIILSYPGVYAIMVHRLAHLLCKAQVPLIPRIMSEKAHSVTGIDIHPGAQIGDHFFIDHGTGVVIGETCQIGSHVKIYQGVTLGAMSFPKDGKGRVIKGKKRHPTLEDGVTIYAGATLLGAITIGANSVVGGNVWLTDSIPANTVVTISEPDLVIRTKSSH